MNKTSAKQKNQWWSGNVRKKKIAQVVSQVMSLDYNTHYSRYLKI